MTGRRISDDLQLVLIAFGRELQGTLELDPIILVSYRMSFGEAKKKDCL